MQHVAGERSKTLLIHTSYIPVLGLGAQVGGGAETIRSAIHRRNHGLTVRAMRELENAISLDGRAPVGEPAHFMVHD